MGTTGMIQTKGKIKNMRQVDNKTQICLAEHATELRVNCLEINNLSGCKC